MAKAKKKVVEAEAVVEAPAAKEFSVKKVSKAALDEAIVQAAAELEALNKLKKEAAAAAVAVYRKKYPMCAYNIPCDVKINGKMYPKGTGQAPKDVVEVLLHAAGSKQMRVLREKVGTNYEVVSLVSGGIGARIISQEL